MTKENIIQVPESDLKIMKEALRVMVAWGVDGMFGDGDKITEKTGYKKAKEVLRTIYL